MQKDVYAFDVVDNDDLYEPGFALYVIKNNQFDMLHDFEASGNALLSLEEMIDLLKLNAISVITTYVPNPDRVNASPCDISCDYQFQLCELSGKWHRYAHNELCLSPNEQKKLFGSGIEVLHLLDDKVKTLECSLRDYES